MRNTTPTNYRVWVKNTLVNGYDIKAKARTFELPIFKWWFKSWFVVGQMLGSRRGKSKVVEKTKE